MYLSDIELAFLSKLLSLQTKMCTLSPKHQPIFCQLLLFKLKLDTSPLNFKMYMSRQKSRCEAEALRHFKVEAVKNVMNNFHSSLHFSGVGVEILIRGVRL